MVEEANPPKPLVSSHSFLSAEWRSAPGLPVSRITKSFSRRFSGLPYVLIYPLRSPLFQHDAFPAQVQNIPEVSGIIPPVTGISVVQMKTSKTSLLLMAAMTGLLGGTAARLQAAPVASSSDDAAKVTAGKANAGKVSFSKASYAGEADKHSCKGKNDCKGQGGCKSGDNGCKGKNSCKGHGGCATDGSNPPQIL